MSETTPDGADDAGTTSNTTSNQDQPEMLGAPEEGSASTTEKPPGEWVTGDEPATGAQKSYLDTLAREAGEQIPADLNKAEASENIDRLRSATGKQ